MSPENTINLRKTNGGRSTGRQTVISHGRDLDCVAVSDLHRILCGCVRGRIDLVAANWNDRKRGPPKKCKMKNGDNASMRPDRQTVFSQWSRLMQ